MADSQRVRVALFGRFCKGDCDPEAVRTRKDNLRKEAQKRNYDVVEEFWEEGGTYIETVWRRRHVQTRSNVSQKLYWIPIAHTERQMAPQLVQNPGY